MLSAVHLPQTASPLDLLVVACVNQEPAAVPAAVDEARRIGSNQLSNSHVVPASTSTTSDIARLPLYIFSPVDAITSVFDLRSSRLTKKRNQQHLGDGEKTDTALAALEGVRIMRMLLLAEIKPAAASSNPAMYLVVDCLSFSFKKTIVAPLPWSWLEKTLLQKDAPIKLA